MEIGNKYVEPTTDLFREPSAMTTIIKRLAPKFGGNIQIASVGCSSGEEVYSLLFLHQLSGQPYRLEVDGYDYQAKLLEMARTGVYTLRGRVGEYRCTLAEKLFGLSKWPDEMQSFPVPDSLKAKAGFYLHDINDSPLPQKYPVIMCANVIYHHIKRIPNIFDCSYDEYEELSKNPATLPILNNLAASLLPGGFLVCDDVRPNNTGDAYDDFLKNHPAFTTREDLAISFGKRRSSRLMIEVCQLARVLQRQ